MLNKLWAVTQALLQLGSNFLPTPFCVLLSLCKDEWAVENKSFITKWYHFRGCSHLCHWNIAQWISGKHQINRQLWSFESKRWKMKFHSCHQEFFFFLKKVLNMCWHKVCHPYILIFVYLLTRGDNGVFSLSFCVISVTLVCLFQMS